MTNLIIPQTPAVLLEHAALRPSVDWPLDCAKIYGDAEWLGFVHWELGYSPDFSVALARAGIIGLHDGYLCHPLRAHLFGSVIGRQVCPWPRENDHPDCERWTLASFDNPLGKIVEVVGAQTLVGQEEIEIMKRFDLAIDVLGARNWRGEQLPKPILVAEEPSLIRSAIDLHHDIRTITVWVDGFCRFGDPWLRSVLLELPESVEACEIRRFRNGETMRMVP
jgi:hypothetical protein